MSDFVTPGSQPYRYEGDNPDLQFFYRSLERIRQLGPQLDAVLAAGQSMKGCLNEADYDTRLAVAAETNGGDLPRIIHEQTGRRIEYARARAVLAFHLIPQFEECAYGVLRGAKHRKECLSKMGFFPTLGMREIDTTLAQTVIAFKSDGNYLTALVKAKEFVAEEDMTRGKGIESLVRKCKNAKGDAIKVGIYLWQAAPHQVPVVYDMASKTEPHFRALETHLTEQLWPTLSRYELLIAQLRPLQSYNYGPLVYEPELADRLSADVVSDQLRHCVEWAEEACKTMYELLDACHGELAEIKDERWRLLAMSNYLGAHAVLNRVHSASCQAHNMTITGGGGYHGYRNFAHQHFDGLASQVQSLGLDIDPDEIANLRRS